MCEHLPDPDELRRGHAIGVEERGDRGAVPHRDIGGGVTRAHDVGGREDRGWDRRDGGGAERGSGKTSPGRHRVPRVVGR